MSDHHKPAQQPASAFVPLEGGGFRATDLTRGPWDPAHQHAGPPIALAVRAIERTAAEHKLTHVARITANLLRPIPIGECSIEVHTDYAGRNAAHFSARMQAGGKEVARFTALVQRESEIRLPENLQGHPLPAAPRPPEESPAQRFPFDKRHTGYQDLIESRVAAGRMFRGPSAVWFHMRYPLLPGETPSGAQRVAVAADSSNGISAVLDFKGYLFVNSDLTVNLLRRPQGEWVCVDARTLLGPGGGGIAEAQIFDTSGLVGRATQSLAVRQRG
jgi:hypothetical protein